MVFDVIMVPFMFSQVMQVIALISFVFSSTHFCPRQNPFSLTALTKMFIIYTFMRLSWQESNDVFANKVECDIIKKLLP